MAVACVPVQRSTEVKSVEMHHESPPEVLPSDNVGFNVKNVSAKNIKRAYMTSDSKNKPACGIADLTAQATSNPPEGSILVVEPNHTEAHHKPPPPGRHCLTLAWVKELNARAAYHNQPAAMREKVKAGPEQAGEPAGGPVMAGRPRRPRPGSGPPTTPGLSPPQPHRPQDPPRGDEKSPPDDPNELDGGPENLVEEGRTAFNTTPARPPGGRGGARGGPA